VRHVDINPNWEGDIEELVSSILRVAKDPCIVAALKKDKPRGKQKQLIANRRLITDYLSGGAIERS
jgi:hypothetical protein